MNPISGTFRLGSSDTDTLKPRFLDFLHDEKEIYELFMVVDEELKMMCDICDKGGQVLGPFLKPMSHLVHTEYFLAGPHQPRPPRGAARHHVRRHGHRQPGAERLPPDQAVRVAGPRLLRRSAGALRSRRPRRPGRRQPDRDPHRRRRPRGPPHRHGRCHARARLRPGVRGGRDARQGGRHPGRLRPGRAGARAHRRRRGAGQRRGRAAGPPCAQPAARVVLADRPVRYDGRPGAGGQARGDPRRRGRLREHAPPRPRCRRHDQQRAATRVVRRTARSTTPTW